MIRTRLALVLALTVLAAGAAPPAQAADNYVSLGDSFVSGPLIPTPVPPLGCLRSSHNYPRLAQPRIGLPLRDASCSGATTAGMSGWQGIAGGWNPPQLGSLAADTRIVSLAIGGNDIGFSALVRGCITLNPFGSPCRNRYVVNGVDTVGARIDAVAPKLDAVLDGIRARSPRARVFVLNYPAILPETGRGCFPQLPIALGDVPYLRAKQRDLNAMIAARAAANGARLVDWYAAGIGRDACQPPSARWVEPLFPGNVAASLHPNRRGMQGAADALVAAVGAEDRFRG